MSDSRVERVLTGTVVSDTRDKTVAVLIEAKSKAPNL